PNRSYGGEGVLIGPALTQAEWESAVERALAGKEQRWGVQQLASIPVAGFRGVGPDGCVHAEPVYVGMGVGAATRGGRDLGGSAEGGAVRGRGSQKQVLTVAQRGGICAVLVGHPPGRLLGPDVPRP